MAVGAGGRQEKELKKSREKDVAECFSSTQIL